MKNKVDVIIVADSSREEFRIMTQNCIDSVMRSDPEFDYNIIIVESWDGFAASGYRYEGCRVVIPGVPFNYNLFLQYGIAQGEAEWVALCNNDLIFDAKWMVEINYFSRGKVFQSFSPWCPLVHPSRFQDKDNGYLVSYYSGYRIAYELTGWCIITKRDVLKQINLDTRVDFWFSDNIYADELIRLGIKHALVKKSIVTHLGSQTLNTRSKKDYKNLTIYQDIKYKNR
jgi:GT2 family glycosyltransferase